MSRFLYLLIAPFMLLACEQAGPVDEQDGEAQPSFEDQAVEDSNPAEVPLVDISIWNLVDEATDPLVSHRPEVIDCPEGTWYAEEGTFEVQTGVCNYFSGTQPMGADLELGDTVHGLFWHNALGGTEQGEGHIALLIDERIVWQETVMTPSPAELFNFRWEVDESIPAGVSVTLHLHNHGYNTWTFFSVGRER
jgi:hypothetical protein